MDWAERVNRRADLLTPEGRELSAAGWRELVRRRDNGESLPELFGLDPEDDEAEDATD